MADLTRIPEADLIDRLHYLEDWHAKSMAYEVAEIVSKVDEIKRIKAERARRANPLRMVVGDD